VIRSILGDRRITPGSVFMTGSFQDVRRTSQIGQLLALERSSINRRTDR